MAKRKRRNGGRRKKRTKIMRVKIVKRSRHVGMKKLVPRTMTRSMVYADFLALNPAAGVLAHGSFRANSAFNPRVAAGGHQPMGFDQLMLLYNRFRVVSSSVTCHFWFPGDSTPANPIAMCFIKLGDNDGAISTSSLEIIEQRRIRYKYLQYQAGSNNIKTLKYSVVPHKYLGVPAKSEDNFGTVSADPVNQVLYLIGLAAGNNTGDVNSVNCNCRFVYNVEFSHPETDLAQS